ncbi:MAG: hypothetical protein AB9856_03580 [Cellulosilyticaceae bacterium]
MKQEKKMQFANFNITFGENNDPMLTHFEDIIFPAFTRGYMRGKENEYPQFSFSNVMIKEINEEYVLVGDYIKNTQYNVVTTMEGGELVSSPADIPTAPYSRFIIFLKNHKMVLTKNESLSPDIRSFQATVRAVLSQYTYEKNKELKEKNCKLPIACTNIVDIPLKEDIEQVLEDVNKIKWVNLRFFPLNNDINPLPMAQAVENEKKLLQSRIANVRFNSPQSKKGVQNMIEQTAGLAATTMEVEDRDGRIKKIKEGSFSSAQEIKLIGNISYKDDETLCFKAKKNPIMNKTSEENISLYRKCLDIFKNLMS